MYPIVEKTDLPGGVFRYRVCAPEIARKAAPGQFVILRVDDHGERIPITIADADPEGGTLLFYVQAVGVTTLRMSRLKTGDRLRDLAGPLGLSSPIEPVGRVVAVGGGFGIAALYPIVKAHVQTGNAVTVLLGARTRQLILMETEMRRLTPDVLLVTDDGSVGRQGLVTDALAPLLETNPPDLVIAIGPLIMMKAVSDLTRPAGVATRVSLNPIMVDGTGMCGACRVNINGRLKFACVDGPEFDGHQVDFDSLLNRLQAYKEEEQEALKRIRRELETDCPLGTGKP